MQLLATLKIYQKLLRFDQSLFGLPFLCLSALIAIFESNFSLGLALSKLALVCTGFLIVRFSGMAFNQLIDCHIDAKNKRTASRAIPSGQIRRATVSYIGFGLLALFLFLAYFYNFFIFILSLIASLLIVGYPYTKRFFAGCHFVLGSIHAMAIVLAYAAIADEVTLAILFLAMTAFFTVSGSDIYYALQDREFDIQERLHSLPVWLGEKQARLTAFFCHLAAIFSLTFFGLQAALGPIFAIAPLFLIFALWRINRKKRCNSLIFNTIYSLTSLIVSIGCILWDIM